MKWGNSLRQHSNQLASFQPYRCGAGASSQSALASKKASTRNWLCYNRHIVLSCALRGYEQIWVIAYLYVSSGSGSVSRNCFSALAITCGEVPAQPTITNKQGKFHASAARTARHYNVKDTVVLCRSHPPPHGGAGACCKGYTC